MNTQIIACSSGSYPQTVVMDCLQKNTTEVRNMKQYLLTVLFNAPTTMSNHYTSQVNHDMYGGF